MRSDEHGHACCRNVVHALVTSPYDTNEYRIVTLSNCMTFILAHNPTTTYASAAGEVGAGSFADPVEWPGLSHFTEHMLFMGSTRYPGEHAFNEALQRNGGQTNAYTSERQVVYYFSTLAAGFDEVLDIWAGFFEEPLFAASSVGREVKAVDNEFSKGFLSDDWRLWALSTAVSSTEAPYYKFSCGNSETLNKTGLRGALLEFYNETYGVNRMSWAIVSPSPLDESQALVESVFGNITTRTRADLPWIASPETAPQPFPSGDHPDRDGTAESFVGVFYRTAPAENSLKQWLSVRFPVPVGLIGRPQASPKPLLSYLMGYEAAGTPAQLLKELGLAEDVQGGVVDEYSWFTTVGFEVSLTSYGSEAVDEVMQVLFGYIEGLRYAMDMKTPQYGLQPWWETAKMVDSLKWTFASAASPEDHAQDLAHALRLQMENKTNVMSPPSERVYDSELTRRLLSAMTPDNAVVIHCSPQYNPAVLDLQERWYEVKYNKTSIDQATANRWLEPHPYATIIVPAAQDQPYVVSVAEATSMMKAPAVIRELPVETSSVGAGVDPESSNVRTFAMPSLLPMPNAEYRLRVWNPTATDTREETPVQAMTRMVAEKALTMSFSATLYQAGLGALSVSWAFDPDYLEITISGLHPKQEELLKAVMLAVENPLRPPPDSSLLVIRNRRHASRTALKASMKALRAKGLKQRRAAKFLSDAEEDGEEGDEDDLDLDAMAAEARFEMALASVITELGSYETATDAYLQVYDAAVMEVTPQFPNTELLLAAVDVQSADVASNLTQYTAGACVSLFTGNTAKPTESSQGFSKALEGLGWCTPGSSKPLASYASVRRESRLLHQPASAWDVLQLRTEGTNDAFSAMTLLGKDDILTQARAALLEQLISDAYFDQIRTKETLGYVAFARCRLHNGGWHLINIVQSNDRTASYLEARSTNFLGLFAEIIRGLPPATFNAMRTTVATQLAAPFPASLAEESAAFWNSIVGGSFDFGRRQTLVDKLRSLSQEDMAEWYTNVVVNHHSRVSVQ
eukprot:gene17424-26785_t